MNQHQRKYALERVSAIETKKLDALRVQNAVKAISISDKFALDLIITKKVKFKTDLVDLPHRTRELFDLTKYERPFGFTAGHAEQVLKVQQEASRIRDEIMLGDAEVALSLINSFAGE